MKKQIVLACVGILLVITLFLWVPTAAKRINNDPSSDNDSKTISSFSIEKAINAYKPNLTPSQSFHLAQLEADIANKKSDITTIVKANLNLANFWKDSINGFEPYVYYLANAAKLENSEKNLTFAAQLLLDNLRGEQDEAKLSWETRLAIELFEKALQINPEDDNLKIGLGSCYIFGNGRYGAPEEVMKGIQQVLSVVRKDSTNMKAQMVLGIGGFISKQYDKAIYRLKKVVTAEPNNLEAVAFLADAYAANGNKAEAVKYYEISKRLYNSPQYSREVDERIKQLQ